MGRSTVLKLVVLYCLCLLTSALEDDHHHEEGSHAEHGHDEEKMSSGARIIEEISEHIDAATKSPDNQTVFTYKDIKKLFKELNFRNCSERSTKCNLCFTPEDLMGWYKYALDKVLTAEELNKALVGILYILTVETPEKSTVCKTFIAKVTSQSTLKLHNMYLKKYGDKNKILNADVLNKFLLDIKKTIGHKLSNKKCFSAYDVKKSVDASEKGFNEHDFEYVSAFIVLKLLEKNCIKHQNESALLPSNHFFVESILSEFGNKTHMTHESFEVLLKKLNLGMKNNWYADNHDGHADHDGNYGHDGLSDDDDHGSHGDEHVDDDHRSKRSPRSLQSRRKRKETGTNKCYSADEILRIFSVSEQWTLDERKFQELCPALIQQIESGACNAIPEKIHQSSNSKDTWRPWVGAMVATIVISLGSLSGIFLAPFNHKPAFSYMLMFLICIAVSTLTGDAILHLLPHSLDLHKHGDASHQNHESGENELLKTQSFLWKVMTVLLGLYLFFIFEILMHAFSGKHGHSHNLDDKQKLGESHKHIAPTDMMNAETVKGTLQLTQDNPFHLKPGTNTELIQRPSGMDQCKEVRECSNSCEDKTSCMEDGVKSKDRESNSSVTSGGDSNQDLFKHSEKVLVPHSLKSFKSVVWMVLIGDAIHNFMDGVAIGGAFSEEWPSSLHGGISTSIAILCHELPHELGDFAILLSSGMSIKQALVMNFVSSLTAFAGAILGVSLGTKWDAVPWIFAITTGLFLYIALVDMLPEMLHNSLVKQHPWICFGLQNLGLLTGFTIMFILAAWEEDVKSVLK